MIRAIIFDLDSTLSTAKEIGPELLEPVFNAIRRANKGRVPIPILEKALLQCWHLPLDVVAEQYGFPYDMFKAGWNQFSQIEVSKPLLGYPDIGVVAELPVLRFLVTSGFQRLQASKIRALGIEPLFTGVYIDALDDPNRKGKQRIFEIILHAYHLCCNEVLVVGDNPTSEIAAGNQLGMKTVQILRPGIPRGNNANCYINELHELHGLIRDDSSLQSQY